MKRAWLSVVGCLALAIAGTLASWKTLLIPVDQSMTTTLPMLACRTQEVALRLKALEKSDLEARNSLHASAGCDAVFQRTKIVIEGRGLYLTQYRLAKDHRVWFTADSVQ